MRYPIYPAAQIVLAQQHVGQMIEVLEELLAVPELRCVEPDELFASTREIIAKASVIRSAVLDELAPLEGAS
jgi:hypothetical protein